MSDAQLQLAVALVAALLGVSEVIFPFLTPYKGIIHMFFKLLDQALNHDPMVLPMLHGESIITRIESVKEPDPSTEPSSSSTKTIKTWSSD